MRRLICAASAIALPLFGLTALSTPASADPCGAGGGTGLGVIDIGGLVYIDDRDYVNGNGLWIYVESNGQTGLQRGASNPLGIADPSFNDSCVESSNPDLNVF